MSVNIEGKIYRNLQEQVGYNSEQIKKIFDVIDGLNIQDNVVTVSDISQVLTMEELETVRAAVAFILYNGSLYIKKSMDSSVAKFDIIFTITEGTAITFSTSEITVTLATGALTLATNSVAAYSTVQMDTLLAAKADITYVDTNFASIAGANFTGAITAPSITENMSGYSFVKTPKENLTMNYIYAGVVKNGNKLTLVINVEITRTGSVGADNFVLGYFIVPASIASLLYPSTTVGLSNVLGIQNIYGGKNYYEGTNLPIIIYKQDSAKVVFTAYNVNSKLVENTLYNFRIEQTFLLSDNLAS